MTSGYARLLRILISDTELLTVSFGWYTGYPSSFIMQLRTCYRSVRLGPSVSFGIRGLCPRTGYCSILFACRG